ncbi:hypothetical protein M9H77_30554 [Catharanthus roseus]|uniref:Uncharacterized protein n=1 Tax=Catharanthus roseus TaxID=4058 RepID=A0ACB9ZXM1_CATRO|nr:hypothetical protein M9H77_30554 [Catharanthus roseus]
MNENSIEKEDCNEFKEEERLEEKERLVERSCIFDSTSILSKESEHFECSMEKEYEFEKSESINEFFIEKQESIKKEKKEKEVVALDKIKVVSVFTYQTNSILVSDSSCVQKVLLQNMENEGSLDYKIYKTISFFTPTSYLCFDHFLKETKLNSFALIFYRISLEHPCTWTSMLGRNHTMEFEEKEEMVGKEPSLCH